MLLDALRRLVGLRAAPEQDELVGALAELAEVDRIAAIAMTACTCGHVWHAHEHQHVRTSCDRCACPRFHPAERRLDRWPPLR